MSSTTTTVATADNRRISNPKADTLAQASEMLRSRLGSGLRTAFACLIVGLTTIYGPKSIRDLLAYPAFSYVTAVLISGEATLGDSLRDSVHAFYGIMLSMIPTILSLMAAAAGGHRLSFSVTTTSIAVALGSFMVALPESTSLITKRIALGQIVLVYIEVYKKGIVGGVGGLVPYPVLHAAASTSIGVVAAVLAVLLPYPRLASREVKEKSEKYIALSIEKMRLLLAAFCADDKICAVASISQAKSLSEDEAKLLKQGVMQWERPWSTLSAIQLRSPSAKLEEIVLSVKGMEMALSLTFLSPVNNMNDDLKNHLHKLENHLTTVKLSPQQILSKDVKDLEIFPIGNNVGMDTQNLPYFFFLFCIRHLCGAYNKATTGHLESVRSGQEEHKDIIRKSPRVWRLSISSEMFMVALKCSVSMGAAVFLGLHFDKNNGQWSGLTVAMAITQRREATFKLANLRAQGTALGSVYGVLCSFLSQNLMELRFLALLPWLVFTSFLRRSLMYGHAGGIAAAVSAIVILGRKNYGSPTFFAIERLSETFIGLLCFIIVEILLQPTRASTLARLQLSRCINLLKEYTELVPSQMNHQSKSLLEVREKTSRAMEKIQELGKLVVEAESEPGFWFLPFNAACYRRFQTTLTKMIELANFLCLGLHILEQELHNSKKLPWETIQAIIMRNIETVDASIKLFGTILQINSLNKLDKELQRRTTFADIEEAGEKTTPQYGLGMVSTDQEECDRMLTSFLQNAEELLDGTEDDGLQKNQQVTLALGGIGFCIHGLMKETMELEKDVLELLQCENPSKNINLSEISCKIKNVPQWLQKC